MMARVWAKGEVRSRVRVRARVKVSVSPTSRMLGRSRVNSSHTRAYRKGVGDG